MRLAKQILAGMAVIIVGNATADAVAVSGGYDSQGPFDWVWWVFVVGQITGIVWDKVVSYFAESKP